MSEPKNKKLYEEVKTEIYKKHPKHSAYRSAADYLYKNIRNVVEHMKVKKISHQD